jgi:integral membrane sensor domain MASE1
MFQQAQVSVAARRRLLVHAAVPLAYVICGRLGLFLAVPPGYATAVFLPAGIAVGAMFMAGASTLPGIFVGSLLLNVWIGYAVAHQLGAVGLAAAVVIACASTLQAAVGGTALRRLIGYPAPLDKPRDILVLLLLSPVFCVTSATLSLSGMLALRVVHPPDLAINWMTWWVGDTLGVLVALPLLLVVAGQPRELWRSRARFVALPMLVCFALFVAIFVRVTKWENEEALLEFRMQSQRVSDVLRATLDEQALLLGQLSRAFGNRAALNRQDFDDLVQQLLQRFPTIQAVEWAPRVEAAERAAFERAQQPEAPGFAIRERDASGRLRPAGDRRVFYPVTFIDPLAGNEQALGFDLTSSPERQTAIEAAITGRTVAATAPIRLVQESGEQAGILLVHPVSGRNGPGIVLIVLRMGSFAGAVAGPLASTLQLRTPAKLTAPICG